MEQNLSIHATVSLASKVLRFLAISLLGMTMISCASTTDSTEGTSKSFANTSEASTKVTSSTSPDSSSEDDDEKEARAFTTVNFDRVKTDMAAGGGEYLASLASLLGVPPSRRAAFFELTQRKFSTLVDSNRISPDALLAKLDAELAARPDLRR